MSDLFSLHCGDCRASMAAMPAGSVQMCVTSPPYFGLRDYGHAGQIGLEVSVAEYVAALVSVFDAVARVLRDDGTLWVNLGDSIAKKSLMGVPWRVAFALQDAGWILRSDIIWHKPSPMPSSVRDRCTTSHEYLFMLAKRPAYYFDQQAIAEPAVTAGKPIKMADGWDTGEGGHGAFHRSGREKGESRGAIQADTRNARSVWRIASQGFAEVHFATFPVALPTRCILAGTSAEGCCPACGSPWVRVVERERVATRPGQRSKVNRAREDLKVNCTPGQNAAGSTSTLGNVVGNRDPERHVTTAKTVGWRAGCDCGAGEPVPCTVLDCFSGAGTTGVAAVQTGRRYVGCELNADYLAMSERRILKAIGGPSLFDTPDGD